jgi:glucose/arabinose dehydrogenase
MSWRRLRLPLLVAALALAAHQVWRARDLIAGVALGSGGRPSGVRSVAAAESKETAARVRLERVASGFDRPLFVIHSGDGSGRLFVVEQGGRIHVLKGGAVLASPFLDVTAALDNSKGERGLLGLAFAPDYGKSGYLFVAHTAPGPAVVVRRFHVSADPDRADPSSGELVLSMADPFSNHNGGMLTFGPDGYLWVGTGDGGAAGDPYDNARNPKSLLGKLLRLDVRQLPYRSPVDNPFVRGGGRPEVWALGLRNPWRFSFDRGSGELWIGDVGQNAWEEIDLADPRSAAGIRFGWKTMEGGHCFSPRQGCDPAGLALPVHEYGHDAGCSVTGGYVYRGKRVPALLGAYLFGDYCRGTVWTLRRGADGAFEVARLLDTGRLISSFGEDEAGEVYLCDHGRGEIFRFAVRGD